MRGPKHASAKRKAPILPLLGEWLEEHVPKERLSWDKSGWLFQNPDGYSESKQWSETRLRHHWYGACDAAKVERIGLYRGTKHTVGTLLKNRGADDRVLATYFGHSDIKSVETYSSVQTDSVRAVLVDLFGGRQC